MSPKTKFRIPKNPFVLKGYYGPEFFCDREAELKRLEDHIEQDLDTTLFSIRRMGKTGLIHHFFNYISHKKDVKCIYIDVFSTQNIEEFTTQLASSILQALPKKNKITSVFLEYLKSFNPTISFDPLNGNPEISFKNSTPQQNENSIKSLFDFLENHNKSVIVAIDEFQQVATYPEKNIEALLRTIIQSLTNVNFIFCGSHKHLLLEIFNDTKRPFFASTSPIHLEAIPRELYKIFIRSHFEKHHKNISDDAIDFILDWTKNHTYYTQALCNKVFHISTKNSNVDLVKSACETILNEQESIYFQYRNLLTSQQWNLLQAIAKEDKVFQPTGFSFTSSYDLGNASSVKRSLEALVEKEMVIEITTENDHYYSVYDCFLSRWLARI